METCTPHGCELVVLFGFLLGLVFSVGCVVWGMVSAHRRERRVALDSILYGIGITRDGKRIDPRDIYTRPSVRDSEK